MLVAAQVFQHPIPDIANNAANQPLPQPGFELGAAGSNLHRRWDLI